jgi:hypothetical protein
MDQILDTSKESSDLEHLRSVMNFHFCQFYKELGVSLDEHIVLHACAVIEYLIYYRGNDRRMQEKLRYRYPAAIFEILEYKNHQQSEYMEDAEQRVFQSRIEASQYKMEKSNVDQKNYALTAENERLQKVIWQQNQVLRNLQDRLDSVNNSGQQFG